VGRVWVVGVAWGDDGYTAAAVSADGRTRGPRAFTADTTGVGRLLGYVREVGGEGAVTVIDPSNGTLEGALDGAGLRVVRARRLAGRGQDALRLARDFHAEGAAPDPTPADTAAQDAAIAASEPYERRLGREGRWLARGPAGSRQIALTFDDGPHPPYTDQVLDILRAYNVPATFFCVGLHARALPGTIARIREAGHTLANHTWSHPSLTRLPRDEVRHQLDATSAALAAVTGERPTLMRPPYGDRSPDVLEWIAADGLTTVLWDTDTRDWSRPGTDTVTTRALTGATDGSVILMHDGGGDRTHTVEALPRVIEHLLAADYTLVTVDRMLRAGPG
jgi:peptidoglycan/xylan/chitin deacetylase (PgdA/CDA1 family)